MDCERATYRDHPRIQATYSVKVVLAFAQHWPELDCDLSFTDANSSPPQVFTCDFLQQPYPNAVKVQLKRD